MHWVAWAGFLALIGFFLALDLGVFHKKDEVVTTKGALRWTLIWFVVAMLFNVAVYFVYENNLFALTDNGTKSGHEAAIKFFTGMKPCCFTRLSDEFARLSPATNR